MNNITISTSVALNAKLLRLQADLIEWQANWANSDGDQDWFDYCGDMVRNIQSMIIKTKNALKTC